MIVLSLINGYLHKDNMDVYVTGSTLFLSKDIITEFAGRGDDHMYPLSFSNLCLFIKETNTKDFQSICCTADSVGSSSKDFNDKTAALENLFGKIYISIYINATKSETRTGRSLEYPSSSIGSLTNPESSKYLGQ